MPQFAANITMMFNEYPFLERFQAAADAGFNAVEYLFPYEYSAADVAERLKSAALTQVVFNMPPGDWTKGDRGLAALPHRRAEFLAALDLSIVYARTLGTRHLHMMAGIADGDDAKAVQSYREALHIAAQRTGEAGVGLLIEPINARDMPGYFLNHFARAFDFVREMAMPHVRLQFDIYHRQILHGDVLTSLRAMLPWIGHIQTASVPDRHEPSTGELNDALIFSEIDRLGYTGYVGCEYRPKGPTTDGLRWLSLFAHTHGKPMPDPEHRTRSSVDFTVRSGKFFRGR